MTVTPRNKRPVYAGLSVSHRSIELVVFSPKTLSVEQSVSVPVPSGLFDPERDTVQDEAILRELLRQVFQAMKPKPSVVHLSLPGTLLRLVEMPKIDSAGLYLSLSSEAERYKTFDNTDAAVDFVILDTPGLPQNVQQLVLGAVRNDALSLYFKLLKELKVKIHSVGLEPLNILRGMAGTGVLDSLVQQIGMDAHWGMMLVDSARIRFSVWQCDKLVEFRELSMDTRNFAMAANDSLVVEDLLEEIRRTTKTLQPALWLTHNMPADMENVLANHLGCPVRQAPVGNSVAMTQPLPLAALGCAMNSVVPFPFDLDIAEGLNKSGSGNTASGKDSGDMGSDAGDAPGWLIPAGVGSLVLGGLASAVLWGMATVAAGQIDPLQSKVDGANVEIAGLQSRQAELKRKAALDQTLIDLLTTSKVRNVVYVNLTDDLKKKTPLQVWIQTLSVNNTLELEGKALNHKSVINFAKSFDAAPYTKAVLIDSIMEGKMGNTIVYDFKISGGVNLDKKLLNPPETQTKPGDHAKPDESSKPGA